MICIPGSRSDLLAVLRDHEVELRAEGIESVILFGSLARDQGTATSDVDLAIRASAGFSSGGFDHFGRLAALRERLAALVGRNIDLVEESAARPRLRDAIMREGVRAF